MKRIMLFAVLLFGVVTNGTGQVDVEDVPPEKLNVLLDKSARVLEALKLQEKIAAAKVSIQKKVAELQELQGKKKAPVKRVVRQKRYSPVRLISIFRAGDTWGALISLSGAKARAVPGSVIFGRYRVESCSPTGCVLRDLIGGKVIRVR